MADPVWNMVVKVQGQAEVEALTKKIEASEAAINRYTAAFKAGMISQQGYEGATRAQARTIVDSKSRVDELTRAFKGNAMGLLQVGQAVDDVQYGFRAIVNNIPGIIMGFGGGAGLAGAVGIAAVAINQLINHWGDLVATFDGGATKREAEEMKTLADHTEKAAKEYERLKEARTGPGEKSGKATGEAIAGIGAEQLREGIRASLEKESPLPASITRAVALGGGATGTATFRPGDPEYDAMANEKRAEFGRLAEATVGDMNNPETRSRVMGMIAKDPGAFPPDAAHALSEASPERMAEKATSERKAREFEGERKATDELNKAKKDAADQIKKEIMQKVEIAQDAKVKEVEGQQKVLEKRREALNEQEKDKPTFAIRGDWQSKIDSMTTERFNRIPSEQLTELKAIKKEMEKLNDRKKEIQGAKFG